VHVGQVQVILLGGIVMAGEEEASPEEEGDRRVADRGAEGVEVGVRAEDWDAGMFVIGVSSCMVGEENGLNENVV
jgi:hypothetical protein